MLKKDLWHLCWHSLSLPFQNFCTMGRLLTFGTWDTSWHEPITDLMPDLKTIGHWQTPWLTQCLTSKLINYPIYWICFWYCYIKRQKDKTKKAVAAVRRLPPASFPQKCRQALLIYLFFPNMDFYLSNYLYKKKKRFFILSRIFPSSWSRGLSCVWQLSVALNKSIVSPLFILKHFNCR